MPGKLTVRTSTPLISSDIVILASIHNVHDPDSACITELSIEQRVRIAWERFKDHEVMLAHQRKVDARRYSGKHSRGGLPPTTKRGRSSQFVAAKIGLKATAFLIAESVVRMADFLRSQGRSQEADGLLSLLNNVSVNAAKRERDRLQNVLVDRLLARIQDEEAIQNEVNDTL